MPFDEWFLTKKLDKQVLGKLWSKFYREAIKSGLRHKPLRYAVSRYTHGDAEFGGYREEFRNILNEIWCEEPNRKSICDGFKCDICLKNDKSTEKEQKIH